jgi:hypothetical protein
MIYHINKGINKPIEFKGLQAQYIAYLAVGLVGLLLTFAIGYLLGVSLYVCLALVSGGGGLLFVQVFRLNHRYGQYGLMKKRAKKYIPQYIRCSSRKFFSGLIRRK